MMNLSKLLLLAFGLSGMTSLIYEVTWTRPLQLMLGSTVYVVSVILSTFMIGFALGAFLFRNFADRHEKPLLLFGKLELGIGLYGLIVFFLFDLLSGIFLKMGASSWERALQLILCFLVLILPATLFGASWPVFSKAYVQMHKVGKDVANAYSFNSLGSFFGSILSGFVLIPVFGISMTSMIASFMNLLIAGFVLFYFGNKNFVMEGRVEKGDMVKDEY